MNKDDVVEIGYFQKPHGYKGQIGLAVTVDNEILFDQVQFLLLEIDNLLTPFFIEKLEAKHKILVKIENCNSDTEAKKFQSKKVFLPKELILASDTEETDSYAGYKIVDVNKGELGVVIRLEEMPANDVFVLEIEGKEVLLPAIEEFIMEINEGSKTIKYMAPEGLIDMYLES